MKLTELHTRPPQTPLRELHIRYILFVVIVAPVVAISTVIGVALGWHALVTAGVIAPGASVAFIAVLALIVVAVKLSWIYLTDTARRWSHERDAKRRRSIRATEGGSQAQEAESNHSRIDHGRAFE
jgi:uncharacterized membrane protein